MKQAKQLLRLSAGVLGAAAVGLLVMLYLNQAWQGYAGRWTLSAPGMQARLEVARWIVSPLAAGLTGGAFAAALFRTRRLGLPFAPSLVQFVIVSVQWLRYGMISASLSSLAASTQWKALLICLPVGALVGIVLVRRLYPARG